ncbi:MAG: hypothetical protein ACRCX2_26600 [Paraclostridium sp.]
MYAMKKENNELFNFTDNIEVFEDDIRKLFLKIDDIEIKDNEVYMYIDNNVKVFKKPVNMIKPNFDYSQLKWIETATPEEIEENVWRDEIRFYNEELGFATKAVAELKCEIISQDDFEDVKVYMQSIDPYAQTYKFRDRKIRPDIFNRYQ